MFTKLRSLPWSLYRWAFSPACRRVRSASSSPTVAPSASTASCLSVYGRSGVGIRIFAIVKLTLFEARSIVFQKPHRHVPRLRARVRTFSGNGHDDVRERRPRMIKIVLRWPRRMVGMRMIEAEQIAAELGRPLLRHPVVRRPNEEAAPRTFFRRVRQRHRRHAGAVAPDQRPAALVRIRF